MKTWQGRTSDNVCYQILECSDTRFGHFEASVWRFWKNEVQGRASGGTREDALYNARANAGLKPLVVDLTAATEGCYKL